jgi:antirestriction protein
MTTETTIPRIYVASLSDYNAGKLHGAWIDADQSAEEIGEEVSAMLAESEEDNAEEWAIHDFEGFGSIRLSEWETFETVAALGELIAEHGAAFAAWYDACDGSHYDVDEIGDRFGDQYRGHFDSAADYARELFDDTAPSVEARDLIDAWPFTCIDWEHAANELRLGGDCTFIDAGAPDWGVYVFDANA